MTQPDIAHPISVLNQFMLAFRTSYWNVVHMILYLLNALARGLLYSDCSHGCIASFPNAN